MKYALLLLVILFASCKKDEYDLVIHGAMVYDGTGKPGTIEDVGINADTIAAIGDLVGAISKQMIDAKGLALSPGFIDAHSTMLGECLRCVICRLA